MDAFIAEPRNRQKSQTLQRLLLCMAFALATGGVILSVSKPKTPSQPGDLKTPLVSSIHDSKGQAVSHPSLPPESARPQTQDGDNSNQALAALQEAALTYKTGRNNIYFREEAFLRKLSKDGVRSVERIRDELLSPRSLNALPQNTRMATEKPPAVMARMGMLDILEGFLSHDLGTELRRASLSALTDTARSALPRNLDDQTKRVLVAEKYDSIVALAHHDRDLAFKTYAQISDERLRQTLRPALLGGLLDSGMPPTEAQELLSKL